MSAYKTIMGPRDADLGDRAPRRLRSSSSNALAVWAQEGDQEAARILYQRCFQIARRVVWKWKVPEDVWHELAGSAFVSCVRPGKFNVSKASFETYFRAAFLNQLRSNARKPKRYVASLDALEEHQRDALEYQHSAPFSVASDQEQALRKALRDLCAEWRAAPRHKGQHEDWARVAELRYEVGLPVAEVASHLVFSVRSVENILTRHVNPAIRNRISPNEKLAGGCDEP